MIRPESYSRPAGLPNRRSLRLKGYDYSRPGAYFVTIVTQNRACLFGEVVDGAMRLNEIGKIVRQCWLDIPAHFAHTELDEFVVMPNHVHGIIVIIDGRGTACRAPTEQFGRPVTGSIPTVIRSFKSAVTTHITQQRGTPGAPVWQRNYYEHIIRNEGELHGIREYITNNPLQWAMDREHPDNIRAHGRAPLQKKDDSWRT
ncbi:MAG: hypothetical protein NNA20_01135 [Nitrospira sp.]|nr:hypothetical protein [Nitrospira sp.]